MIVGDYLKGANHLIKSNFRNRIIYIFLIIFDYLFTNQIKRTKVLVNSIELYKKYKAYAKEINLIKTTTLSKKDFFSKFGSIQNKSNLLIQ